MKYVMKHKDAGYEKKNRTSHKYLRYVIGKKEVMIQPIFTSKFEKTSKINFFTRKRIICQA